MEGIETNEYRLRASKASKDDGGPAFGEFQQAGDCSVKTGGMSLRDYFAAKAQAGMLANYNVINTPEHVAQMAYAHADAMLAERAKP